MRRKDLEQVYYLKKELHQWQMELARLQEQIATESKPIDGMPFTKTNKLSFPVEDKAIRLEETSKIIDGRISEIKLAIAEIDRYILSIDDPVISQIVFNRCVNCMKWDKVAKSLGNGYTDESCRQIYCRFVKSLD